MDEHILWLKENVPQKKFQDVTVLFNEHFHTNYTDKQIRLVCRNRGILNGLSQRFTKSNIPFNKGTKGLMKANSGSFKKGNISHTQLPVGSERITTDGYAKVKIAEPNKWRFKHLMIYEEHHGEIPEGNIIVFLNGNKLDLRIENLFAIDRATHGYLNMKKIQYQDIDLQKSAAILANLVVTVNKMKKARS